jgi:hypothetical protein
MKKILFIVSLVLILSLVSCGKPPLQEDLNRENQTLQIRFISFSNEQQLIEGLRSKGYNVPNALLGFSIWSPNDNQCTVYHVTPKYTDDERMNTLGHEVAHCIYGSFH